MKSYAEQVYSLMEKIRDDLEDDYEHVFEGTTAELGYILTEIDWEDDFSVEDVSCHLHYENKNTVEDESNNIETDVLEITISSDGSLEFYLLIERDILDYDSAYCFEEEQYDSGLEPEDLESFIKESRAAELKEYEELLQDVKESPSESVR
jgi:hypothetical protein